MSRLAIVALMFAGFAAGGVRFSTSEPVLDLRAFEWECIAERDTKTPDQAMNRTDWKRVRVGQRWDEVGYPEFKRGAFWVRLSFTADASLNRRDAGFFATLIDDEADIFLNGEKAGSVKYRLGSLVRGPAIVNLTPYLRIGHENTLLIHTRDTYARSAGLIGNICLYQTIPYTRTQNGGIVAKQVGPLSVALHLGDALLSRGGKTSFTKDELAALRVPPYILRQDELILVAPAAESGRNKLMVELDDVNPIWADQPLHVSTPPPPAEIARYTLLELPVDVQATYDNPFDPADINVQVFVETPSHRIEKVSAFFRQDFRRVAPSAEEEILLPVKGPAWRVYYRPRELGTHKLEIVAQDRTGIRRYDAGAFRATPSKLPGYLHVSKRDPSFFEYDNGDSFFAIGPSGWYRGRDFIFGGDTRWVSSRRLDDYYQRKAENRSNYEYLGTFHFGQILTTGGIVDQHVAWKLENALRTMERLGIRWLFFHDDVRRMSDYGVDALPSSRFVHDANEVYFSEGALAMQKAEIRYLIARMADSPSIWIWNFGDEWRHQFGNRFSTPMVRSWIQELHAAAKRLDIYGHPHAIGEGPESIQNGGEIYLLEDWYLNHLFVPGKDWRTGPKRDLVDFCVRQIDQIGERSFPTINVEGGLYAWNTEVYQSGKPWGYPEAITFHQHLWLGLFLKNAASGTDWLVNVLDHDGNLFHAKALASFLDGVNLTAVQWQRASAPASDSRLTAFALTSERGTMAWVVNRTWNWLDWVDGRKPVTVNSPDVTVPVARPGHYRVEFWNTRSGTIESSTEIEARGSSLRIALPPIETDIAVKATYHD